MFGFQNLAVPEPLCGKVIKSHSLTVSHVSPSHHLTISPLKT